MVTKKADQKLQEHQQARLDVKQHYDQSLDFAGDDEYEPPIYYETQDQQYEEYERQ